MGGAKHRPGTALRPAGLQRSPPLYIDTLCSQAPALPYRDTAIDNGFAVITIVAAITLTLWIGAGRIMRRSARRAVHRHRARLDRFKLTKKSFVIEQVLADPSVHEAVRAHATEQGVSTDDTWNRVRRYLDEIVPFFNILAYYRLGYGLSRVLLGMLYKVTVEYARPDPFRGLPRDSIVVYLMNHRSNADYVVVSYVLMGDVSISYAVGEWARAFPLEYIFKSFGSYFIRRKFREPLYHAVLRAYVQLITRNGVTQGIFPEGGLTRDGTLRPGKIGLLDSILCVASDQEKRSRMFVVPVGVNYDRVLEDRTLLRELSAADGQPDTSRLRQAGEVLRYVFWNTGRLLTRRWRRYGRAAVTIGEPISIDAWLEENEAVGVRVLELPRTERLPRIQAFCDEVLKEIGAIIPVTPVPLACAALQSFDADFIPRDKLLERMSAMRDVLLELNGRVVRSDRDIAETFDRALRMLKMRRILAESGDGFALLPHGRPLVSYYANSIVHLLGPFSDGIRQRDALPANLGL
jgi:glycerol-3-phosphate O-acyltransferase